MSRWDGIADPRRLAPLLLLALALFTGGEADGKPHWSQGPIRTDIQNLNCSSIALGSPYLEYEIGANLAQRVDRCRPRVGETFYIQLLVATIGSNCVGTRPRIELALPPGVKAVGMKRPGIRCLLRNPGSKRFRRVGARNGCPRKLLPGVTHHPHVKTWYSLNPPKGTARYPAWNMPQGTYLKILVPVRAKRRMSGIGDRHGCACAVAAIRTMNGTSMPGPRFSFRGPAPSTGPYVNLFAFGGRR